jgi:starvation-inducible DNA-binding protein
MSLKFTTLDDGSLQVEGVGIPFGGPVNGKDLHGQFFSTKTDFAWDLIPDGQRPLLYQHGLDSTMKTNVIGRWSVKKVDDAGVWIRAQLDARNEYIDEIKELLDSEALGLSSATMGHLVKVSAKTGEILRWPVVELSLTPNPANPSAYVVKTVGEVAPVEYVEEKLAVLKYSDDQPRDERGRFGSGGGSAGSGDSSPAYPSGYGLQGTTEERAAIRKEIDKLAEKPEATGFPKYVNSLNEVETQLQNNDIGGAHSTAVDAAQVATIGGESGMASAFSTLANTINEIGADAYADHMTGFTVPGFGKSAKAVATEEIPLADALRNLLSDVVAFYLEAHGAHWNVVGDDFTQYHDLFGEIYSDVYESIDPLAENIRKLGAAAPFDLRDIASDPSVGSASGAVNPEDLCEELYASNSVILLKILSCFNMATSFSEQGIANFLAERQDMHKKWAWQLSASLDPRGEQSPVSEAAEPSEPMVPMASLETPKVDADEQPAFRLAVKAGTDAESEKQKLEELKKQIRAIALDAAKKNIGRK